MSMNTPTNSVAQKNPVVTTAVKDAALVAGGFTWSVLMLVVGMSALAIGIISIPVMFFMDMTITGEVIEEAAVLTGQEPHTPVATHSPSSNIVVPVDPNNVSHADPTSDYRGSSEKPAAFPSVHGTD